MNFSFQLSFRIYPGAQPLGRAYGYYGADSGLEVQYFWVADSLETVQRYYEEFTLPFRDDAWDGTFISVFADGDLSYMDVTGRRHEIDGINEMRCHYTEPYKCINVRLIQINPENETRVLPNIVGAASSSNMNATPSPLVEPLKPGTLIIYSYYINDF